jgi:glycosyltransferase involved in cell wall biosynthesis
MKIRFLVNSRALGGAERYALRLADATSSQTDVAIAGPAGAPILVHASAEGIPTENVAIGQKLGRRTALRNLAAAPKARRWLHQHVSRWTDEGWCVLQFKWEQLLWAGEVAPERVCLLEHGPIPTELLRVPVLRRRLRRAFESAGVVLAASVPAQGSIRALCGREAQILCGGVSSRRVSAALTEARAVRRRLGISDREFLLTYAGRVVSGKGVCDLVDLAAGSGDRTVLILGEGPALRDVTRLAKRRRVADRVLTLGEVDDVLPYLAASDATVLMSRQREGRPLLAVESLAVGVPMIALASPAMEGLADEFGNGAVYLVPDASGNAFSKALESLRRAPRREPVWTTWRATAQTFLSSLGAVPRSSIGGGVA